MKRRQVKETVNFETYKTTAPLQIRLLKDLEEVKEMLNVKLEFPDQSDIQNFIISIIVQSGLYAGKWFRFHFNIPDKWPYVPPNVLIMDKIWHPNIQLLYTKNEMETEKDRKEHIGKVCLSILKEQYVPETILRSIVAGLQYLLQNPNPNDTLNIEAGKEFHDNYNSFKSRVDSYLDKMNEEEDE